MAEPTAPERVPSPTPSGARRTVARTAIVVVCLGSALMWLYAFSGVAATDPPNRLDDPAFAAAAEPRCAEARAVLDALPPAPDTPDPDERADVLDDATATLAAMVADLRALPAAPTERDRQMLDEWLGDWETFVGDRADFASRLRDDPDARFYVSEKAGDQITDAIDNLAEVNDMASCATPGDVG